MKPCSESTLSAIRSGWGRFASEDGPDQGDHVFGLRRNLQRDRGHRGVSCRK